MNIPASFEIKEYEFSHTVLAEVQNNHYANNLWPIVYIISDGKSKLAYVGETTDTFARMSSHLKHVEKSKLTAVHFISGETFNKSATLDIESNLIKYMSADGTFTLINGNLGLANHNYYQKKEVYWDVFKSIWNNLRSAGISSKSLEHIDNSDLFKYSPYKSLTNEQKQGLLVIIRNLLSGEHTNILMEGGAGTGKTILAVFLFKLLNTNNEDFNFKEFGDEEVEFIKLVYELKAKYPKPRMALVVPMSSFRKTLQKVFRNIKGLTASMVIGPAEVVKDRFDIIIVDEAHRLRRRINLGAYFGAFDKASQRMELKPEETTELDWVIKQADNTILFYDESQSIKPSDVRKEDFDSLKAQASTKVEHLKSQFRVRGGNDYIQYIDSLLKCKIAPGTAIFNTKEYEFILMDSIEDLVKQIKLREEEHNLSRLIAGYSWEWISNKPERKHELDIHIDNVRLRWNSTSEDWINSPDSVDEVGCIHTTQGYDLNYAGIIFGNEISYDKEKNEIVIIKEKYYDKLGKQSIKDPNELKDFILNIYTTIMKRGIRGTYVYACDPNLREYLAQHIKNFKENKHQIKFLEPNAVIPFENSIPVYDLKAAAGNFSDLQNVSELEWITLPETQHPSRDLFACRVLGESMNKIIPSGSLCLFRKYTGGSRNGLIALVQSTNIQESEYGSGYTVKEYHSKKSENNNSWNHESITLKPLSNDPGFTDIELRDDELTDFKVLGIFVNVIA